jgi:lipoprotein-anchoring transpeptidase ErfK/SrfK
MTFAEPSRYLKVDVASQTLEVIEGGAVVKTYPVSTARNGVGELNGSGCTPRGWHVIRAKIGGGQPLNAVFVGRRPTGEVYTEELGRAHPERDWIVTRILWLGGLEPGLNRYGQVDTGQRYIYIHGSPDSGVNGQPLSHGCIRMRSMDVAELFELLPVGCRVLVAEAD